MIDKISNRYIFKRYGEIKQKMKQYSADSYKNYELRLELERLERLLVRASK